MSTVPALESMDSAAGMRPVNRRWLGTNLPCRSACPVGTHAGGYVSLIAAGNFREAYLLARRPNPFASICGRICAHPCEAACRRQYIDEPISIRALKRFVTEKFGVESAASREEILQSVERPRPAVEQGGRVAIVGAGPAGLACAHDLALMGHHPVIFDAAPRAGGMMRLGIPEYRLPRDLIDKEIDFILSLGVELQCGVEIGRDITLAQLEKDYDAVFLAPGCRKGRFLPLDGADLEGVITAVDFLVNANLGHPLPIGERVLVVGGGNVAFDVARSARRFGGTSEPDEMHHNLAADAAMMAAREMGKEVILLSLESREEMPADLEEIEEALKEGITLIHRRGPHRILGADGRVRALETVACTRVFDEQGRFAPLFDKDQREEVACDTVILAVGQVADLSFLGEDHGLEISPRSTVVVDRATLTTSRSGVWAGGDVAFGPRIVIEAVGDGRRAARSIDSYLTGRQDEPSELYLRQFDSYGYEHPFARGDYDRLSRAEVQTLAVEKRVSTAEVELVYTPEEACREGARCLHCWINTIFDSRQMSGSECIQCGGCVDVCPEDCIDLVSLLRVGTATDLPSGLRLPDGKPLEMVGGPGAAMLKDETRCIRCGLCARRCPVGCITMQGFYNGDEVEILAGSETSL